MKARFTFPLIFGLTIVFCSVCITSRGFDTGDPGTPFIGRVVNLFGYLIGIHPGKWPDKPDKNIRLKQCADILRSAIDTNQIEIDSLKLTNQPEVLLAIRNYTNRPFPI